MTSIMWPTRSRVSQPVQRVSTFQFFGSETMRVKLSRSRRNTVMTVSFPSAAIGFTGVITAVLIGALASPGLDWTTELVGAGRRRGRHDDRRQYLVEALAPHLEPGRQAQHASQLLRRLVDGEARTVGRDLEQHPARLAVVDRLEVPAVDHGRDVAAGGDQLLTPRLLCVGVGGSPRDVVDGADRL